MNALEEIETEYLSDIGNGPRKVHTLNFKRFATDYLGSHSEREVKTEIVRDVRAWLERAEKEI